MSATTETLQVYQIPAENMPGLMAKLDALSKKSVKLIGKPIALKIVQEVRKPFMLRQRNGQTGTDASGNVSPHNKNERVQAVDAEGNFCWDVFYDVTIDAETPKIAGWSFIATIDHSASAGNIVRTAPNANCEVPAKYRTAKAFCDHCNKIRSRRDTFLLRSDTTGEFKQIGRTCIRDFIGYDVEQVVAMAEIVNSAVPSDSDGDYVGSMGDRAYIKVSTYLAHVSAMIRVVGWVSRKDAEYGNRIATASLALSNMFPAPGSRDDRIPVSDKDFATAEAALEWAQKLTGRSDYEHNLMVVANETMVESRSTGLLASLLPAFFRAKEWEFQRAERAAALKVAESQHVGKIGDKIGTTKKHAIAPFEAVLYGFKSFEGRYGVSYRYLFSSDDHNVFVWWASEGPAETLGLGGLDAANRVRVRIISGTVKSHVTYQDVKQTVLTRCKVEVIKD